MILCLQQFSFIKEGLEMKYQNYVWMIIAVTVAVIAFYEALLHTSVEEVFTITTALIFVSLVICGIALASNKSTVAIAAMTTVVAMVATTTMVTLASESIVAIAVATVLMVIPVVTIASMITTVMKEYKYRWALIPFAVESAILTSVFVGMGDLVPIAGLILLAYTGTLSEETVLQEEEHEYAPASS